MVLFASMLASGDNLQLASVKAVDQNYPLVGGVELRSESKNIYVKRPPDLGQVWLDLRLMDILKLEVGQTVSIGDADFIVSHSILSEPDRASNSFAFAPKAIINAQDLEKTNVVQPGKQGKIFDSVLLEKKKNSFLAKNILEKTKQPRR
ncbi:MAG: hypothetical protein CM1200mP12_14010 [Gammaproteobacteria bacterium]|nr:MAG: hypothetical protein CM1200mP12_14010 [Gammaproteobacteria bacterium]